MQRLLRKIVRLLRYLYLIPPMDSRGIYPDDTVQVKPEYLGWNDAKGKVLEIIDQPLEDDFIIHVVFIINGYKVNEYFMPEELVKCTD